ncbi:hypothetical protein FVEG_02102 [Fusarium verticillioides 7600]|uniref:Uncharacterized protein n=1 Tax=Gibberella moniliformis (strain M3125 / FGSC 7600) TaxID=334819 RepID=W7M2I7_GIBM7|nr:hypothetical protein FVEG_02102 [Fusarium verticillioides 7600]EWG39117.1 hypothetical protein FVEG_02102 [Fusarium verticillioides 7600]
MVIQTSLMIGNLDEKRLGQAQVCQAVSHHGGIFSSATIEKFKSTLERLHDLWKLPAFTLHNWKNQEFQRCNDAFYNTPKNVVISLQSRSRVPAEPDVLSVFSPTLLRQEYDAVSPLVVQRQPASRCLSASTSTPRDNRIADFEGGTDFASPLDALKSSFLEILPGTFAKFGYTVVEVLRSDKRVLGSVEVRGLMYSSSSTRVSRSPGQHGQPGLFVSDLELMEAPASFWAPCAP